MADMRLNEILEDLKANPIFRMSLGSKELFHSNFLEFLWDLDHLKFIETVNYILPNGRKIVFNPESVFDREKENFDVCIHHFENKIKNNGEPGQQRKNVYDLIIENKVKSIPRIDQLKEYEEKVNDKSNTIFILLSLVIDFPCKTDLVAGNSPWIVVHYDRLKEAIENHYKDVDEHNLKYITDYCHFVEQMHILQDYMIQDFDNQVYYDKEELDKYKILRIHDLYIKLRGSLFITRLKDKLEKEKVDATIHILPFNIKSDKNGKNKTHSFKYEDIRPYCEKNSGVHVFLDCTIQQGNGMVAAYVYKERGCDFIYEIAIQGNQYRHGINSHNESDITLLERDSSKPEKEEAQKLQKLWNVVSKYDASFFESIHDCKITRPENHYNKYAPEYVYKYVELKENEKVAELIAAFAKDINSIIQKLNR